MDTVIAKLRIFHGGTFVKDSELKYVGGHIETIEEDIDTISVPHLKKFIIKDIYRHVETLSWKLPNETMDELKPLLNNSDTIKYSEVARVSKNIDIYVEHGVDEPEIVSFHDVELPLPLTYEGDECTGNEGNKNMGNENECNENDVNEGSVDDDDNQVINDDDNRAMNDDDNQAMNKTHNQGSMNEANENEAVNRRRGKYRVDELLGEDGDVESVYYDSDNPPSYHSDIEPEEAELQPDNPSQRKGKCEYPSYNPEYENYELELGKYYEDGNQFKMAAVDYAVHYKRDICYYKNEPMRVILKCAGVKTKEGEVCPFHCTASWEERYKCFQIKTIHLEHKCNQQYFLKMVSQKWIEEKYEDKIRKNPCIGHEELKDHIEAELKITIHISKVGRAIKAVRKKINMSFEDQFRRIRDYAQECINSNPGSTVKIKTNRTTPDSPCVFQRIYFCFDALRNGFLEGCRKIIGLDGCFLKGLLKGEILSAVGRDANDQMYPIAWAVVENENTDSWRWFLQLLKNDLGITNTYPWTIISDQQKGLVNVIQELFPESEHRNCARHVHANWSKKHRGMVMKNHFWMLAKSTTKQQFQEGLQALERKDNVAKADLDRYPPKFWCKVFFRTFVKCDKVDNNLSEAFNATLVKARCKPIIPILEDMRVAVMKRIAKKISFADNWQGNYGPLIMKKLTQNIKSSLGWKVDFNGDDGYEIKKGPHQFKVKLANRTCSCRSWDLSGIPCPHAICVIFDKGRIPESYVDTCYSKEAYQRAYRYALEPVNGELFWPKTTYEEILAPIPKKMPGRPKKNRTPEENEGPSSGSKKTKLTRKGRVMKCSICRSGGHTRPKCPLGGAPANSGMLAEQVIHPKM